MSSKKSFEKIKKSIKRNAPVISIVISGVVTVAAVALCIRTLSINAKNYTEFVERAREELEFLKQFEDNLRSVIEE